MPRLTNACNLLNESLDEPVPSSSFEQSTIKNVLSFPFISFFLSYWLLEFSSSFMGLTRVLVGCQFCLVINKGEGHGREREFGRILLALI